VDGKLFEEFIVLGGTAGAVQTKSFCSFRLVSVSGKEIACFSSEDMFPRLDSVRRFRYSVQRLIAS